jgi:hypothetical protein
VKPGKELRLQGVLKPGESKTVTTPSAKRLSVPRAKLKKQWVFRDYGKFDVLVGSSAFA